MRDISGRLNHWSETRPWLFAIGVGMLLAAILTTIGFVLFDSPDWLFLLLLTVTVTLAWGFRGKPSAGAIEARRLLHRVIQPKRRTAPTHREPREARPRRAG
jgi:hypothetical protein